MLQWADLNTKILRVSALCLLLTGCELSANIGSDAEKSQTDLMLERREERRIERMRDSASPMAQLPQAVPAVSEPAPTEKVAQIPLIIAGEGGPSQSLFTKTALTYAAENGGVTYEVRDGDAFVAAMREFRERHGRITKFAYFGHGNAVALFVNQQPGVNAAVYANDPVRNDAFRSASVYQLPGDTFAEGAMVEIFGCNTAAGFPAADSFAQRFADHFSVTVRAATGPTEFSARPDKKERVRIDDPAAPAYLVATYEDQGYVSVAPRPHFENGFADVRKGQPYADAIMKLRQLGLLPDVSADRFAPYRDATYGDAKRFCELAFPGAACELTPEYGYKADSPIRNLHALRMLADAVEAGVAPAAGSHEPYLRWADTRGLLTEDFPNKKWYTRAEMAQLTANVLSFASPSHVALAQ